MIDFERLTDFLLESDPEAAVATTDLIVEAIDLLANHPLAGTYADSEVRELVISRGKSGYVALYHYDYVSDVVVVLTIRHQREAGYPVSEEEDP